MMYYSISKNKKNLFFGKKNRPGVGSDLKCPIKPVILLQTVQINLPNHLFSTENNNRNAYGVKMKSRHLVILKITYTYMRVWMGGLVFTIH